MFHLLSFYASINSTQRKHDFVSFFKCGSKSKFRHLNLKPQQIEEKKLNELERDRQPHTACTRCIALLQRDIDEVHALL